MRVPVSLDQPNRWWKTGGSLLFGPMAEVGERPGVIECRAVPAFTAESAITRFATPLHSVPALLLCELEGRAVNNAAVSAEVRSVGVAEDRMQP